MTGEGKEGVAAAYAFRERTTQSGAARQRGATSLGTVCQRAVLGKTGTSSCIPSRESSGYHSKGERRAGLRFSKETSDRTIQLRKKY